MRGTTLLILFILLSGFLAGCATAPPHTTGGECYNKTLPILLDATDLKSLFQDMAREICSENCVESTAQGQGGNLTIPVCTKREGGKPETVLVTDFADIQSFLPNQSGLLMGELMRGGLSKVCNYKIMQVEFAKFFKLSENGLVVLTRNVRDIKNDEYNESEAVVGTYSYLSNSKVVLFVRKINITTGKISRMVTREINYYCAGRSVTGYTAK
jgi:hypothetical protein